MEEYEITTTAEEQPEAATPPARRRPNVAGIVGFALAIQGLCLCWYPFIGFGSSLAAWIVSYNADKRPDRRFSHKGVIMGIIGTFLGAILTACALLFAIEIF